MKKTKNRNYQLEEKNYEEYENYNLGFSKKKEKRRPVRNWKKAWDDHVQDYDEYDDFYSK